MLAPCPLPDELDEADEENMMEPAGASEVMKRERVEQDEARTVEEFPLSSPRLELFSRPPPPSLWAELPPFKGWGLESRRYGLELFRACDSLRDSGRVESESDRLMTSLKGRGDEDQNLNPESSLHPKSSEP